MIRLPGHTDDVPVAILAAGDYPSSPLARAVLERAERVVCCDGAAAQFVTTGGRPYAIVGDCDSLDAGLREQLAGVLHCDPDQETNDLTKAVRFCLAEGLDDILVLGATGKREDHAIANISLLAEYALMPGIGHVRMLTDHAVLDAVAPQAYGSAEMPGTHEKGTARTGAMAMRKFSFESRLGRQVSLFTPLPDTRITTHGLRYPLENALLRGWWGGTLNEATGDSFSIEVDGPAVVYRLL